MLYSYSKNHSPSKNKISQIKLFSLEKHRLIAFGLIFILLATSFWWFPYIFQPKKTEAAWYNDNWGYRQTVAITNAGSNQTNYVVQITLNTSTLVTAGKMLSTCNDLRITDNNGRILPLWIEKVSAYTCNTTTTQIFTKVPSIPTSGVTLYLYYGNPAASAVEIGSGVFESFDDFNDNQISSFWTAAGTGTKEETGGEQHTANSGTWGHARFYTTSTVNLNTRIVEFDTRFPVGAGWNQKDEVFYAPTDLSTATWGLFWDSASKVEVWTKISASWAIRQTSTYVFANSVNYHVKVTDSGTSVQVLITEGSTTRLNSSTWNRDADTTSYFHIGDGNGGDESYHDNFRIYQYATTAPSIGSPSNEEKGLGPVGYWKLDEGQGTAVKDATANSNNGTLTQTTWTTEDLCISSKCLYYDGMGDYLRVTDPSTGVLDFPSSAFTLSAWIRHTGVYTNGVQEGIIAKDARSDGNRGYQFQLNTSNQLFFKLTATGNTADYVTVTTTNQVTANTWHLVTAVFVPSTSMSIYVDGRLSATTTTSIPSTVFNNTAAFDIGHNNRGDDFTGTIDDVKVYNYAQSVAQIKTAYSSGKAGVGVPKGAAGVLGADADQKNQTLSQGLVGYWKMDESSWTNDCSTATVTDSSGNANTGKSCPNTTGPTGGNLGKFSFGGTFDGNNDYVKVTKNYGLTNTMTLSAWVKFTSLTGYQGFMSQDTTDWSSNPSFTFTKITDGTPACPGTTANTIIFGVFTGSGACSGLSVGTASTVTTGVWYHVAASYDGTQMRIYLNGNLEGTTSTSVTLGSQTGDLLIGADFYSDSPTTFLNGTLDEVRIYNRALQPSEVSLLYNFAPGPVGFWKFDERSGTTANDSSGLGNTGTFKNNASWTDGKFGGGINFDGATDYIDMGNDSDFSFERTNAFTLGAWIRTGDTSSETIIAKQAPSTSYQGYHFYKNSGTSLGFVLANNAATNNYIQVTATTPNLADNAWHYAALTYDGSSDYTGVKIYLDGVAYNKTLVLNSLNATTITSTTFSVGDRGNQDIGFTGGIDQSIVYNYARTSKQIVEDMNAGHPNVGSPVGSSYGYWKFDDGFGTTVQDSGTGNNDGTMYFFSSPATATSGWTNTGKFSKGLVFDGTDDYIRLTSVNMIFNTNYTWTAWIKPSQNAADTFLAFSDNTSCEDFKLSTTSGGEITFAVDGVGCGQQGAGSVTTTGAQITIGNWYHIAATRDASTNTSRVYVNGVLKGSATASLTAINRTMCFTIGKNDDCASTVGNIYTGVIDEVKVYSYPLTADEVKLDYNQSSAAVLGATADDLTSFALNQSLVGYWKLDETSGNRSDSSGNGNTLLDANTVTSNPGKFSNAGQFTAANSEYLSIPDNATLSTGDVDFTISGWFYLNTKTATETGANKWGSSGNREFIAPYYDNGSDRFVFYVYPDGINPTTVSADSLGSVSTSTWYFVVMWHDSKLNTINIQVNNGAVDSQTVTSGPLDTSSPFEIGQIGASQDFWNGRIDEMRFYKRTLTPSERAYLYASSVQGLVGEWKLDEKTGTTANDTSGQGSTSKNFQGSPDWVAGKTGSALYFSGSNEYVGFVDATAYDLGATTDSYSVSAWMNTTKSSATNMDIVAKFNGSAGYPFILYLDSSEDACFTISGTANPSTCGSTALNDGSWHYLVGVRDVTADTIYIYVDGILANSTTDTTTTTAANNASLTIGNGGTSYTTFDFTGIIDQVQIYNSPLTLNQIAQLYNRGGPIGWWKFDECQGTTAYDSSGKGNNGVVSPQSTGTTLVGDCTTSATSMRYNGRNGKFNSGLEFDGSDDYVSLGTVSMYQLTTATFTAWIYREGTCAFDDCPIVANGPGGNTGYAFEMASESGPPYLLRMNLKDLQKVYGITTIATNKWYHVAGSFDGSFIRLWVNGKLETVTAQTQTPTYANPTNLGLANTDIPFTGQIDDVRIYNYVLTDAQVKAVMNEGAVRYGPISGIPPPP